MKDPKPIVFVAQLTPDLAPAVADLHREALPRGFLSTLSRGFRATLYLAIAAAPKAGVWTAVDADGRCLGFIAGAANVRRCYRDILRRRSLSLGLRLLPSLGRSGAFRQVLQTLSYPFRAPWEPGRNHRRADHVGREVAAELLSISVAAEARGKGVGSRLVRKFEENLFAWGHHGPYRVVTDAEDTRSNAFYRSVGFTLAGSFRHHAHPMSLYTKSPAPAASSSQVSGGDR